MLEKKKLVNFIPPSPLISPHFSYDLRPISVVFKRVFGLLVGKGLVGKGLGSSCGGVEGLCSVTALSERMPLGG